MSGVTCGRPSARTVESQYTAAVSSSARASDHAVGCAPSLLNRGSTSLSGSVAHTGVSSRRGLYPPCLQTSRGAGTERGLETIEVRGAEHHPVARGDVKEVEVNAGLGDLPGKVGEHARPILDVDD